MRLTALFPGLPGWAGTRNVKPIWIFLKQQTVNGSGISWAIRKSAPRSRQITMPVPHHSFFTGRMPFLLPNQQRQSNWGKYKVTIINTCKLRRLSILMCILFKMPTMHSMHIKHHQTYIYPTFTSQRRLKIKAKHNYLHWRKYKKLHELLLFLPRDAKLARYLPRPCVWLFVCHKSKFYRIETVGRIRADF